MSSSRSFSEAWNRSSARAPLARAFASASFWSSGRRDSIHHHLLEAISEIASVLESRQTPLYTTPLWVVVVVYKFALPIISFQRPRKSAPRVSRLSACSCANSNPSSCLRDLHGGTRDKRLEGGSQNPAPNLSSWETYQYFQLQHRCEQQVRQARCVPQSRAIFKQRPTRRCHRGKGDLERNRDS